MSYKTVGRVMLIPEPNGLYTQAFLAIPDPKVPGQMLLYILDRLCRN